VRSTFRYLLTAVLSLFIIASSFGGRKHSRDAFAKAGGMKPFDAVIIPGIPYRGAGWDSVMKARVLWSWILYKNGYVKNVIYSGAAVYTPFKEAIVMGQYGMALGIPAAHIYYDTLARHSTENVYFSYLLAKRLGFKSLALATDPFQSFMLRGFTRKRFGTPIFHIPFIVDSLSRYNYLNPSIDANPARVYQWASIKETESFSVRMGGTLGKSINWKQYKDGKVEPL
jgi:hypothetical protein